MTRLSTLVITLLYVHLTTADFHDHPRHKHRPRDLANAHVVVYVNEQNEPVSTTTLFDDPSPSSSRPFQAVVTHDTASSPIQGSQGGSQTGTGTGGADGRFSVGVTYSPYNPDHSCKSEAAVAEDLKNVEDFQIIRLYGTDCDQVAKVAKALDGKTSIFAGIYDIKNIEEEVDLINSGINGKWSRISAVSVGNELVNSGQATVEQVTTAIATARSALKSKGYTSDVTTVDTMMALQNHPELCAASDFCAINCHAFFDGHVQPAGAGKFVSDWVQKISEKAGKRVVVTETGWPTQGNANGEAQPGWSEHQQAVDSLKKSVGKDLILFTLFNDLWKQDRSDTFHAERYWGLRG